MIVFTFPGQGSQRSGMGLPWRDHPSWELVEEASDVSGRDVADLLLAAEDTELTATRNAQLATFVLSLVVLDAVERLGAAPAAVAGHSLGEYTALVAAGTLSYAEGVRLVAERGEAMQVAAEETPGTMAAVLGLDDNLVETACVATEGDVWVANFNAPGQVVIAGEADAVRRAGEAAKRLGAKRAMSLPVAGAFHTPLMASATDRLAKALDTAEWRDPDVAVVANVDGRRHHKASEWPGLLRRQLTAPVCWRQCLHTLADGGPPVLVELGPGAVLTGMAKRTVPGATLLSVSRPDQLDEFVEVLAQPTTQGRGDEGEGLTMAERLVVSPTAGVFAPCPDLRAGRQVVPGEILGHIGTQEVRSPFGGTLMGILAHQGERVTASQPVAWLRER